MASAESEHNDRFRRKLAEAFIGFIGQMETWFEQAAEAGELRPDAPPPAQLARMVLAIEQGGYVMSQTLRDASLIRESIALWFGLIAAERSQG